MSPTKSLKRRAKCLVILLLIIICISYLAPLYIEVKYVRGWWDTSAVLISVRLWEAHQVFAWSGVRLWTAINGTIGAAKCQPKTLQGRYSVNETSQKRATPVPESSRPGITSTFVTKATPPTPAAHMVFTPGCRIPEIKLPNAVRTRRNLKKKCQTVMDTSDLNDSGSTVCVKKAMREQCFLMDIIYDPRRSALFREGNATPLAATTPLNVSNREYFAIRCGKHIQFHQNFPVTPQVQSKVTYWKSHGQKLPISIMILGLDSVSQLQFKRGLPKTMKLLNRLNFINLRGYHTAYPRTVDNFAALHMGLTLSKLQKIHSWGQSFDKKPIIWKEFNANNYVTMYFENGESFNSHLTGWTRFKAKPTDYYGFPLHRAVAPLSTKYAPKRPSCFSSMDDPEFMLNSTARFALKFRHTPFYSFTYFEYPFHEDPALLPLYDAAFSQFFQRLEESPDLLERTLIVLLGDHGPRFGAQVDIGFSTFLERSLPLFYLRVPKLLLKSFSRLKIEEALRINQNRLTTPYDLHHTLRHVLNLYKLNVTLYDQPYQVTLNDRSSLLVPIHEDRACASVNIGPDYCVCNISSNLQESENPSLNYKLHAFCIDELNKFISSQGYKKKCEKFRGVSISPHLRSALLRKESKHVAVMLVRFTVNPQEARFEVEVRVNTNSEKVERLGPFRRINEYGNQSWCVNSGSKTVSDNLKEVCICKSMKRAKG